MRVWNSASSPRPCSKGSRSKEGSTLISSGYTHRGDPAALEVGPTGLAYDTVRDTGEPKMV
jgi:hypothetical protein